MKRSIVFLALIAISLGTRDHTKQEVISQPPQDVVQYYGYITANETYGANLFYWMFESQNDPRNDPFIVWLTGGPGCSGLLALFFENGPYHVLSNLTLTPNPYSWNKNANLLYVDQPAGTGFSYVDNPNGYVTDEEQVASDFFTFLQKFFAMYPQYQKNPFFITGESFGGHYVPAIAAYIQSHSTVGIPINLQGIAVGNGWIDPIIQAKSYAPYLYANGLIDESTVEAADQQYAQCANDINNGDYSSAFYDCTNVFDIVLQDAGNINVYDIRKQCVPPPLCYDFTAIGDYLNLASTRSKLGVGDRDWTTCSSAVYARFESADFEQSYRSDIPKLLEKIRVLIYNGDEDLTCNFYGTSELLNTMPWAHQSDFQRAANTTYHVGGQVAGSSRTANGLTYVVVANAGHMVPHDQPAVALDLLTKFLKNSPFN